ncbi:30S ribosomal protein S1 [Prosthecochloris sp. N3]|uniref:30S ribosomal protein S1 n=1 Tax=Prosthecochloris ethylica TaxID=2743976 RepID=A0ABR9XU80_9CHLB|nr:MULTISPECIES: 30S ribosomal protein S1 [Prosthecochloris]MEC9487126.1 30S ribosomal protein S1 [Prosthecochloris sp.]MBF0587424.1 30S ribosomal protein S1 [Prosthecochloris ethylica]MBF0637621.1 30S ribosomal protein S1 [Prosthecochloris ethylica]NUK48504.1 30S ribosomal protein S1 [Prosthecochloris ethylica]RNA65349.1 30S ribosomal protein S1 [Prosthecochloris sp. ZM_2]
MSETQTIEQPKVTAKGHGNERVKFFADYDQTELNEMEQLYSSTLNEITEEEIVKGTIVDITNKDVTIDVGFKSEGIVSKLEFRDEDELKVGDEVEVYLENIEDKMGQLILSKRKADVLRIWDKIYDSIENDTIINGKIINRVKGGMTVSLSGVEAFLPGSQIDVKPVRDFDALVGQTMDFRVVKINPVTQNIVVSHKVILEEEYAAKREEMLASIEVGMVLEGTVKNITDFGIFVDLGGLDGLVHITDITWGRINHPSEVVDLDQPIKVVVVAFDEETKRVSLGMKQLEPHPWENIEIKYPVGSKTNGRVVSITDYGAFVEIEKGIEGLVHISEMSWTQHIKHPSQFVSLNQEVEVVILNVDKEHTKLSLSMKRVNEDPWIALSEKYVEGTLHKGTVSNITDFGVFVELEPGVDGLVHISDLSWTKKIRHPSELVKKGQDLEVKVLKFDVNARRIALGHKQINPDPWDEFEQKYAVGSECSGEISQIIEKGVIVILPGDVDGFVPVSHLLQGGVKDINNSFKVGDELPLRVIEFDKENKRIILSALEYFKDKSADEMDEYLKAHPNEEPGSDNADDGSDDE